ncbi:hypothetical protein [Nocardia sp. SSK8]|uniref:hypothetical protein n=1 Tax=Nocardia sp. SSK8 TaxID=3120154 RepID=UPI0030083F76
MTGSLVTRHDISSSRQTITQHLGVLEQDKLHHADFAPLRAIPARWPIPREDA